MTSLTYTNPSSGTITMGPGTLFGITKVEGLDAPDSDSQAQKAPYQDGDTWLDELFNVRDVIVTGWILTPQNLNATQVQRRLMTSIINAKLGPGALVVTKDNLTFLLTAQPSPGPKFRWKPGNEPWQEYEVTFKCHDPYFYDATATTLVFIISTPLFHVDVGGGWAWPAAGVPFSSVGGSRTQTIVNVGDTLTPISFTFGGPATNPTVTNLSTGQFITISTTLSSSDYVTVSTAFGKKTVTIYRAGTPSNGMGSLKNGSQFFSLALGPNSIQFSDDTTSALANLTLTYSNRYIGM